MIAPVITYHLRVDVLCEGQISLMPTMPGSASQCFATLINTQSAARVFKLLEQGPWNVVLAFDVWHKSA